MRGDGRKYVIDGAEAPLEESISPVSEGGALSPRGSAKLLDHHRAHPQGVAQQLGFGSSTAAQKLRANPESVVPRQPEANPVPGTPPQTPHGFLVRRHRLSLARFLTPSPSGSLPATRSASANSRRTPRLARSMTLPVICGMLRMKSLIEISASWHALGQTDWPGCHVKPVGQDPTPPCQAMRRALCLCPRGGASAGGAAVRPGLYGQCDDRCSFNHDAQRADDNRSR
jgi:hypothetical protein